MPRSLGTMVGVAIAALSFCGCLKTRERLVFEADGAVTMTVTADGSLDDHADGYPVPMGKGWQPASDDARTWIEHFGASSRSAKSDPETPREPWKDAQGAVRGNLIVAMEAKFGSANLLPSSFAPEAEPYATGFLQRSTGLEIQEKNGRRVYVFERVFHHRASEVTEAWKAIKSKHNEALAEKLVKGIPFTTEEREAALSSLRTVLLRSGQWYLQESVSALYTKGDALISLRDRTAILSQSEEALTSFLKGPTLVGVLDDLAVLAKETHRVHKLPAPPSPPSPLERLETEFRTCLRDSFRAALHQAQVPEPTRNGILARLEWLITHEDATTDLSDEEFTIEVELPGQSISGNFQKREGRLLVWTFQGEVLRERDVHLRAVSVLE